MSMFILGPNGPQKIVEVEMPPCPQCGGAASNVTQHHTMCSGQWTLCIKCRDWFPKGHDCAKTPPRVRKHLFDVPRPPRDNRWRIEWRWKPKIAKAMKRSYNPWLECIQYAALATECIARNEVVTLRKNFPGKSFRYRGYHVGVLPFRKYQSE